MHDSLPNRTLTALLALLLCVAPTVGWPGDGRDQARDHDRARAALQAGEILPLPSVLERVARSHPGDVLEVELERGHEGWKYELKVLQRGGGVIKLELDARTGEVLRHRNERR